MGATSSRNSQGLCRAEIWEPHPPGTLRACAGLKYGSHILQELSGPVQG